MSILMFEWCLNKSRSSTHVQLQVFLDTILWFYVYLVYVKMYRDTEILDYIYDVMHIFDLDFYKRLTIIIDYIIYK